MYGTNVTFSKHSIIRGSIIVLTAFSVITSNLGMVAAQSGRRPVVVTADQPNVWTLDQAHYLLAQMHRRNLDLKAEGGGDLNPNEINGMRIDALRSILDISAEYDESIGFKNREVMSDRNYNRDRRRQLLEKRDELNGVVLDTSKQIAEARIELEATTSEEKRAEIQARIDDLGVIRDVAKEQITQINAELGTLSQTGEVTTPDPSRASTTNGPSTAFGTALTKSVEALLKQFEGSPKLNASLRLDNYIQMQYEILSKQLTLLRDEVGANEKLIFLELPQSINTSYDKADNKWVQSRWNVGAYSKCVIKTTGSDKIFPCSRIQSGYELKYNSGFATAASITDDAVNAYEASFAVNRTEISLSLLKRVLTTKRKSNSLEHDLFQEIEKLPAVSRLRNRVSAFDLDLSKCEEEADIKVKEVSENKGPAKDCSKESDAMKKAIDTAVDALSDDFDTVELIAELLNKFVESTLFPEFNRYSGVSGRTDFLKNELNAKNKLLRRVAVADVFGIPMPASNLYEEVTTTLDPKSDRQIRIVDMFPKQSSLNVNDLRMSSNAFSFKGLFKLLSGFGLSTSYERNRERYSQFVQQELYSSSFGKGSRDFGWTFNPMPGTKRVASGTRTTFAVMIVPKDALGITFDSKGCYFSRSAQQPRSFVDPEWLSEMSDDKRGCSDKRSFAVELPDSGTREFFATAIRYSPVDKGKRVVVTIYGRGFSSQIGVLVNGIPLRQSLGLAQPFILDDSKAQKGFDETLKKEVDGSFERVDSNQLVASFKVDEKFEGLPASITLIAPGKSIELRSLENSFYVNSRLGWSKAEYMFGIRPLDNKAAMKVSKVSAYKQGDKTKIFITGENLNRARFVFVNGVNINFNFDKKFLNVNELGKFDSKLLEVIVVPDDGSATVVSVENPFEDQKKSDEFRSAPDEIGLITSKLLKCYQKDGSIVKADYRLILQNTGNSMNFFVGLNKVTSRVISANSIDIEIPNPQSDPEIEVRDKSRGIKSTFKAYFKAPPNGCQTITP